MQRSGSLGDQCSINTGSLDVSVLCVHEAGKSLTGILSMSLQNLLSGHLKPGHNNMKAQAPELLINTVDRTGQAQRATRQGHSMKMSRLDREEMNLIMGVFQLMKPRS